jgi:hypothetical protein
MQKPSEGYEALMRGVPRIPDYMEKFSLSAPVSLDRHLEANELRDILRVTVRDIPGW